MRVCANFNAPGVAHARCASIFRLRTLKIGMAACLLASVVGARTEAQTPEAYIKSGPVFALDDSFFTNTNVGWSIAGGVRQPLRPGYRPSYFFVDVGGSFLSVSGDDDPVTTSGQIVISSLTGSQTINVADLFYTRLVELRRGSFDAAIGWTSNPSDGLFHSWIRGGGRVGHIRGVFNNQATATTQGILATVPATSRADLAIGYDKTDTFGGLFFGGGINMTTTSIDTLAFGRVFVSFGAEGEFSVDWIDFMGFGDDELVTTSLLFNMTLSR